MRFPLAIILALFFAPQVLGARTCPQLLKHFYKKTSSQSMDTRLGGLVNRFKLAIRQGPGAESADITPSQLAQAINLGLHYLVPPRTDMNFGVAIKDELSEWIEVWPYMSHQDQLSWAKRMLRQTAGDEPVGDVAEFLFESQEAAMALYRSIHFDQRMREAIPLGDGAGNKSWRGRSFDVSDEIEFSEYLQALKTDRRLSAEKKRRLFSPLHKKNRLLYSPEFRRLLHTHPVSDVIIRNFADHAHSVFMDILDRLNNHSLDPLEGMILLQNLLANYPRQLQAFTVMELKKVGLLKHDISSTLANVRDVSFALNQFDVPQKSLGGPYRSEDPGAAKSLVQRFASVETQWERVWGNSPFPLSKLKRLAPDLGQTSLPTVLGMCARRHSKHLMLHGSLLYVSIMASTVGMDPQFILPLFFGAQALLFGAGNAQVLMEIKKRQPLVGPIQNADNLGHLHQEVLRLKQQLSPSARPLYLPSSFHHELDRLPACKM